MILCAFGHSKRGVRTSQDATEANSSCLEPPSEQPLEPLRLCSLTLRLGSIPPSRIHLDNPSQVCVILPVVPDVAGGFSGLAGVVIQQLAVPP